MKKYLYPFLAITLFSFIVSGCHKSDSTSATTPFKVRMTDAPATVYDSVIIDVQSVQVTQATSTASTVTLSTHAGLYNLLDFTNGRDTLLASATLPTTTVLQVRLILGSNNYVVIGGVRFPLATPSAQQSGLKINVHSVLTPGVEYVLTLDFDAAQSIVNTGNGGYILKPVIRVVSATPTTGSIKGLVTPHAALPAIAMAINPPDTFSSVTDTSGAFLISGVTAGTYTVIVTPNAPYLNDTIRSVTVTTGVITDVGTLTF